MMLFAINHQKKIAFAQNTRKLGVFTGVHHTHYFIQINWRVAPSDEFAPNNILSCTGTTISLSTPSALPWTSGGTLLSYPARSSPARSPTGRATPAAPPLLLATE